jgi:hypothetical protein
MDRIASRFKQRIQELTTAAQAGTSTARSLVTKIQQAEIALAELEALVYQQDRVPIHPPQSVPEAPMPWHPDHAPIDQPRDLRLMGSETQSLVQRITHAETMLSELKELVKPGEGESLIAKIKRTLDMHQQQSAS